MSWLTLAKHNLTSLLVTPKTVELSFIASVVLSVTTYLFGGWTLLLDALFACIVVDFFSGILASLKQGRGLHSNAGVWGGVKKIMIIASVYLCHRIDLGLGVSLFKNGAIYFWIVIELISIAENYARLGLPFHKYLKPVLSILRDKSPVDFEVPKENQVMKREEKM